MSKREEERQRYLEASAHIPDAEQRWLNYEALILEKYGGDLEEAWKSRDKAHRRRRSISPEDGEITLLDLLQASP